MSRLLGSGTWDLFCFVLLPSAHHRTEPNLVGCMHLWGGFGCTSVFFLCRRNPALPFSQKLLPDRAGCWQEREILERPGRKLIFPLEGIWNYMVFMVFPTLKHLVIHSGKWCTTREGTCINLRGEEDVEGRAAVVSYQKELAGLGLFY